ncbi:uncharacterized protein MONBRDRAFT_29902 [Monosiga brevicollis MX1]|uniref:PDZ domain-containing protein n=1 Tax=Monosiga brevicollis TaxID=81824 RepID=A9VCG5_MONBE|nr:uncharacterized protein MONBRDRAFT_29902 [Monosiga brevicollis MX1]EDQ84746.1 predicted protein [Monosiga brevicollis MX1]|eukprot:XP_001750396.1 hypothetical protein [Monosiga brevicollis MX1]
MRNGGEDGTFLVYEKDDSSPQERKFVLCVTYKGKPTHHLIKKSGENWTLNGKVFGDPTSLVKCSEPFFSLRVLIATMQKFAEENLGGDVNGAWFLRRKMNEEKTEFVIVLGFNGKVTHHLVVPDESGFLVVNKKHNSGKKDIVALIQALKEKPSYWPADLLHVINRIGKARYLNCLLPCPVLDQSARALDQSDLVLDLFDPDQALSLPIALLRRLIQLSVSKAPAGLCLLLDVTEVKSSKVPQSDPVAIQQQPKGAKEGKAVQEELESSTATLMADSVQTALPPYKEEDSESVHTTVTTMDRPPLPSHDQVRSVDAYKHNTSAILDRSDTVSIQTTVTSVEQLEAAPATGGQPAFQLPVDDHESLVWFLQTHPKRRLTLTRDNVTQSWGMEINSRSPPLVKSVAPHGVAASAGLQPGDCIAYINNQDMTRCDISYVLPTMRSASTYHLVA